MSHEFAGEQRRKNGSDVRTQKTNAEIAKAVLTDIHFWIPMVVLVLGLLLLVELH